MDKIEKVKKILRKHTLDWHREGIGKRVNDTAEEIYQLFELDDEPELDKPKPTLPLTQALMDIKEEDHKPDESRLLTDTEIRDAWHFGCVTSKDEIVPKREIAKAQDTKTASIAFSEGFEPKPNLPLTQALMDIKGDYILDKGRKSRCKIGVWGNSLNQYSATLWRGYCYSEGQ